MGLWGLGGCTAAAGRGGIFAALMTDDDELDHETWHSSWQKIDIVRKGDKAGRAPGGGWRLAGERVQRIWAETQEKSSGKLWR